MVVLEGIHAHIVVQDTVLVEYLPPQDEWNRIEPNTALTYIEAVPNAPFSFYISLPAHGPPRLGDILVFRVFMDGVPVAEKTQTRSDESTGEEIRGYLNYDNVFRFPHVSIDLNDREHVADMDTWEDKEIVLQISHGNRRRDGHTFHDSIDPAGDLGSVLAFTFKYRPRIVLKSIIYLPDDADLQRRPWEESVVVTQDTGKQHPADREWKKSLRNNKNPDIYCFCMKIRPQEPVVTCDNDGCAIRSYHWGCVGVEKEPELFWFCPGCRELALGDRKVTGNTAFLGRWSDPPCECKF